MEFISNGNLTSFIDKKGILTEQMAQRFFIQIIFALDYLHQEIKIAHRDLKPDNILLDENFNIRIIDFGLSQSFSLESPELKSTCGSPAFMAPELLKGQKATSISDIWSLGIILYNMIYGKLPFNDSNFSELSNKILFSEINYPFKINNYLNDLLSKLLIRKPLDRIQISSILKHQWITNYPDFNRISFEIKSIKSIIPLNYEQQRQLIDESIINKDSPLIEYQPNAIPILCSQIIRFKNKNHLKNIFPDINIDNINTPKVLFSDLNKENNKSSSKLFMKQNQKLLLQPTPILLNQRRSSRNVVKPPTLDLPKIQNNSGKSFDT